MSEWKEYQISSVVEYKKGFAFSSSSYQKFGRKIVRISDTTSDSVNISTCNCISEDLAQNYEDYQLNTDDIIIATVGSWANNPNSVVGKVIRVPLEAEGSLLNQNAVRLRSNGLIDDSFLYYVLKNNHFSQYILGCAQGSANQASITLKDIFGYSFYAPDIEQQKKISSFLYSIDSKIAVNRRICENLENQIQTIYKNWFIDFAPFRTNKFVDSEMGMIPEGWKYESILDNDYFKLCKNKVKPFWGQKEYYATANVDGKDLCGSSVLVTYDKRPSRADIMPCKNSIWFARMSKSYKILNCFGASNWLSENAIISTGFCGMTAKIEHYGFIYTYLISDTFDKLKDTYATGTTQISLTNQGLAKIKVVLPPQSIVEEFSKIVNPIIEEIENCRYENIKLKATRDNLLPLLLSGEINIE